MELSASRYEDTLMTVPVIPECTGLALNEWDIVDEAGIGSNWAGGDKWRSLVEAILRREKDAIEILT